MDLIPKNFYQALLQKLFWPALTNSYVQKLLELYLLLLCIVIGVRVEHSVQPLSMNVIEGGKEEHATASCLEMEKLPERATAVNVAASS
jgi:hypothetical protein